MTVLLGTISIESFIMSIRQVERKIVSLCSLPVSVLMVHQAACKAENSESNICQDSTEYFILLVTPNNIVSKEVTLMSIEDVDRLVRFDPIFKEGDAVCPDAPPVFRSVAKMSAAEDHNNLLSKHQRQYRW